MLLPLLTLVSFAAPLRPNVAQQSDQAFFAILAETKVSKMAGMPVMEMPQLPPGVKLPPEVEAMMSGKPARSLQMRLWSPGIAPNNATASVTPPDGLKQGKKLDLELYRPKGEKSSGKLGGQGPDPDSNPEFTIKIYWGSSKTVKENQPRIIQWKGMTEDQKAQMRKRTQETRDTLDYFYKPDWTTGYWPTKKQPGKIDADASLVGKYLLNTNYTGSVEIEAPSNVNFLDGFNLSSPKMDKKPDFGQFLQLSWTEIQNVLGQYAFMMGMEGKNTLIMWSSSEIFDDETFGEMDFLQMATVRDRVAKTIFMNPKTTEVFVPAGIFKKADFVMLNMAGYGFGAALEKAQPLPRIQTKTTLSAILSGADID